MKSMRTIEDAFDQINAGPTYAVAALPHWEHYDPNECPAPIREWVLQHYPYVVIEQLSGLAFEYTGVWESENLGGMFDLVLPKPIFRLGFNAKQAEYFKEVWTTVPSDCSVAPDDFYFVILDRHSAYREQGIVDIYAPVIR